MRLLASSFLLLLLLLSLLPSLSLSEPPTHLQRSLARQSLSHDGHGGAGSLIPALQPEGLPASVIVLHGLGGNGNEWAYLFLPVSLLSLTYVNFILPTAPTEYVTYLDERMPSWFNIRALGRSDSISRPDMRASVERINRIVEGEVRGGVPPERVFLMGFSQGGALAYTAFLTSKYRLGGLMGVATWLPLRGDYPGRRSPAVKKRKTLILHGTKDQTIPFKFAQEGSKLMQKWGQPVKFVSIKDGPHELLTKDVLVHLEKFIIAEAPGPTQALSKMVDEITKFFDSLTDSGVL